jgi:hypothetical protein
MGLVPDRPALPCRPARTQPIPGSTRAPHARTRALRAPYATRGARHAAKSEHQLAALAADTAIGGERPASSRGPTRACAVRPAAYGPVPDAPARAARASGRRRPRPCTSAIAAAGAREAANASRRRALPRARGWTPRGLGGGRKGKGGGPAGPEARPHPFRGDLGLNRACGFPQACRGRGRQRAEGCWALSRDAASLTGRRPGTQLALGGSTVVHVRAPAG